MLQRTLRPAIEADLDSKIVLLSGPRQVGKTFLSRQLWPGSQVYLNFDQSKDRAVLRDQSWDRGRELLVLDELHKWRSWKRWLKGVYDTEGCRPRLLVTGSARLDVFRKGDDSLAGRHFHYRLHPLSLKELGVGKTAGKPEEALEGMLKLGGFPEPLLKGSETWARRWRRSHLDRILREDLLDLEPVRNLKGVEVLVALLAQRVGSTISFASLARDLEVSPHTVKHWVEVLERLYVIFVVTPFSKNLARGLLKEPKIYFYDTGRVEGPGARFENLVACHLLKRCHYLEDVEGHRCALHYVRDREKREVDFLVVRDSSPELLLEAKLSDGKLAPSLKYFHQRIKPRRSIQLVKELGREVFPEGVEIRRASSWLAGLET